jgi:hypothetical protein
VVFSKPDSHEEFTMKPIFIVCLLLLFDQSLSFAVTNCKIVEYVDRSEVICIGDEMAIAEVNTPSKDSRATIVEYVAQNQPLQAPEAEPATVRQQQAAASSGIASQQQIVPAVKVESAADHLAKRRQQAERNSRNLKNYSSTTAPSGP